MKEYTSIVQVENDASKTQGNKHWFDHSATFKILPDIYNGHFFIARKRIPEVCVVWRILQCNNGHISYATHEEYRSLYLAKKAARQMQMHKQKEEGK